MEKYRRGSNILLYTIGGDDIYTTIVEVNTIKHTENFNDFIELVEKIDGFTRKELNDDDFNDVAHNNTFNPSKMRMETVVKKGQVAFDVKGCGFVSFLPYKDEFVEIQIIKSYKKGIGSFIMNEISKISEDEDIPLFLSVGFAEEGECDLLEELESTSTRHKFYEKFNFKTYKIGEFGERYMNNRIKLDELYDKE